MLFLDFSPAFNTIISQHLTKNLDTLSFSTPLCIWLLNFFLDRAQAVGWKQNLQRHLSKHQLLSGLPPEPTIVYPDDTRLLHQIKDQPHHKVRR